MSTYAESRRQLLKQRLCYEDEIASIREILDDFSTGLEYDEINESVENVLAEFCDIHRCVNIDDVVAQYDNQSNFMQLGIGSFGVVYSDCHDDGVVVKIGCVRNNIPYLCYLKTIIECDKKSTSIPVIYSIDIFSPNNALTDSIFVIRMERLLGFNDDVMNCCSEVDISCLDDDWAAIKKICRRRNQDEDHVKVIKNIVIETCNLLQDIDVDYFIDMTPTNVMIRMTDYSVCMVVTDPLGQQTTDPDYLIS